MGRLTSRYISVGGNRHPSAADWDWKSGILAFGASENIALWQPLSPSRSAVQGLIHGHTDVVTAVKFFIQENAPSLLITASADQTIRVWQLHEHEVRSATTLEGLGATVNCLAVHAGLDRFASGLADGTIKICKIQVNDEQQPYATVVSTIRTSPRLLPLAIVMHAVGSLNDMLMMVGGTRNTIEVYLSRNQGEFKHQVSLSGHDGWVRSLAISRYNLNGDSNLILASASQDKYIRFWRITKPVTKDEGFSSDPLATFEASLSNKRHRMEGSAGSILLTYEALLLAHEDWIYSISWQASEASRPPRLISGSADNSVAIWEEDSNSGLWVCVIRLGEISLEKGSSTATGSTGGFWNCLCSSSGDEITSLGKTGSWRFWRYNRDEGHWHQEIGVTGHTKAVTDIAWNADGSCLLSTSTDQTTRLHAVMHRKESHEWHEMARPQIHGYDLNCIACIPPSQFISGADEKLLRVFDEPRHVAQMLQDLCEIEMVNARALPDSATVPVLGLSNKAEVQQQDEGTQGAHKTFEERSSLSVGQLGHDMQGMAPTEDRLARHTLWPECEKLYGHGYEIAAVAVSHNAQIVATSCKASSLEHAVIRLYTVADWREIKPPLTAHSLTVTKLSFSKDDRYLLSVGRDRQWAVFEREEGQPDQYRLRSSNAKAHSRMILDASWAPQSAGYIFATASRDKSVKVWKFLSPEAELVASLQLPNPVTTLDIASILSDDQLLVATGTDSGEAGIISLNRNSWLQMSETKLFNDLGVRGAINRVKWRPLKPDIEVTNVELAVAAADGTLLVTDYRL